MTRRPPRPILSSSSAASDVYKRQVFPVPGGPNTLVLLVTVAHPGTCEKTPVCRQKRYLYIYRYTGTPDLTLFLIFPYVIHVLPLRFPFSVLLLYLQYCTRNEKPRSLTRSIVPYRVSSFFLQFEI